MHLCPRASTQRAVASQDSPMVEQFIHRGAFYHARTTNENLQHESSAPILITLPLLLLSLQVQAVVPLHVRLDIEHTPAALPLTLEHFHTRMNVEMDLQRRWPLEHLVAHRTPVAARFWRPRAGLTTVRGALAVWIMLKIIVARQLLVVVAGRQVHVVFDERRLQTRQQHRQLSRRQKNQHQIQIQQRT